MEYLDELKRQMGEKLDAWNAGEGALQHEVERYKTEAETCGEAVQEAMDADQLTNETAVLELKQRRAVQMEAQAKQKLEKHHADHLFTPEEYVAQTEDILSAYNGYVFTKKQDIVSALSEVVQTLDAMDALRKEAAECVGEVRTTISKTGVNVRACYDDMYSDGQIMKHIFWLDGARLRECVENALNWLHRS